MRGPRHASHGVLVAGEHRDGPRLRRADVERADYPVDACGGDDRVAVLVPVVGESFGGGDAWGSGGAHAGFRRGVDGDVEREVVRGGRRRPEVEDAEVGVGSHAADDGWAVGTEGRRVGAGVGGERRDARRRTGVPYLDCAVPAAA